MMAVGKNMIRVDAYSKVTGKALYPQDIYMDNMLFAKTLRSKYPHANIKIDTADAEKVDGIVRIFTYKDIPFNKHGVVFKDHDVFACEKVRRIGDPIAFIVGTSEKTCIEGMNKIKVDYKILEGVFDPIEGMKEDAPKIHGDSNILYNFKLRTGDIEEGFKNSDIIVENTYTTHMVEHVFLQPEACLSYLEDDGTVVIVIATQYPHYDREEIAQTLKIDEKKIKIINTNVGGAFGGREDISMQIHMALAALTLKQPIKTIFSREESFLGHSKRHPFIMKYRTGVDKEGYLQAMEAEIISDSGAYASWATNVLRKGGVHSTGPYHIPNVKVDGYSVYTNNPYAGAMRGFGATQVPVAHEQQMDILAEKLGISPMEIRMKNIFKQGSTTATGQVLLESVPGSKCLESLMPYMEEYKRLKDPSKNIGVGLGLSFYGTGYGNGFPDVSRTQVKLHENGRIGIYVGATEVGQGAKTVLVQIGAETLGIPPEDIDFICEDTSIMPDSGTSAASRQTYNTGNAVKIACEDFIKNLKEVAKKELGLNTSVGLIIENGEVVLSIFPQKRISLKELSNKYSFRVEGFGEFIAQTTKLDPETGQGAPYWPYTFSACVVALEVDTKSGRVELLKTAFAQDAGKAINPTLVEGQIDGGVSMSLGFTLFEDLKLVKGEMKNNKFSKYLIPTAMDMIDIDRIIVEDPESTAPYGAKGVGEPVTIPFAPAVLNAIYDATGVRITELPATPEKLVKAFKENGI